MEMPEPEKRNDLWLLAWAAAAFLAGQLLLGVLALKAVRENDLVFSALMILFRVLELAAVFYGANRIAGSWQGGLRLLKLERLSWRDAVRGLWMAPMLAIALALVTIGYKSGIERLFPSFEFGVPPTLRIFADCPPGKLAALLFSSLLAAPLTEEIFFRRAIFQALAHKMPIMGAAWASALLFAALHGSLLQLPGLCLLALVWQWMVRRTGSLWSSVFLHFFNNLLAVLLLLMLKTLHPELQV